MDLLGFYLGEEFEAYRYLGAQLTEGGVCFRTFAPEAVKISVIGEFNGWTETQMQKIYDGNFWEVFTGFTEKTVHLLTTAILTDLLQSFVRKMPQLLEVLMNINFRTSHGCEKER